MNECKTYDGYVRSLHYEYDGAMHRGAGMRTNEVELRLTIPGCNLLAGVGR